MLGLLLSVWEALLHCVGVLYRTYFVKYHHNIRSLEDIQQSGSEKKINRPRVKTRSYRLPGFLFPFLSFLSLSPFFPAPSSPPPLSPFLSTTSLSGFGETLLSWDTTSILVPLVNYFGLSPQWDEALLVISKLEFRLWGISAALLLPLGYLLPWNFPVLAISTRFVGGSWRRNQKVRSTF